MTEEQNTEDTTIWCDRCGYALDSHTDRCFVCEAADRAAEREGDGE